MKANENNFVSLIRQKREEGIQYVIEEYGGLLKSIVKKRLFAMPDRVEECMNDIFMGIWKNINSYDETRSTFKSWAAGIARFEAIDVLRKYRREQSSISLQEVEPAQEDSELQRLVDRELSEETEAVLSCLCPKDVCGGVFFPKRYMRQSPVSATA